MTTIEKIHNAIENAIDNALGVPHDIGNAEIAILRQQLDRAVIEIASLVRIYFRCSVCGRIYFSSDDKNNAMPGSPAWICCDMPLEEIKPGEIIEALRKGGQCDNAYTS